MLGTSAANFKYKTIHDFSSSSDYLDYLFGDVQGVMYRATINSKYYQNFFRSAGIINAEFENVDNGYVSMNSFFRTKGLGLNEGRLVSHIKRLNTLYVDIDCYKVGLSKKEVLLRLEDEYFGSKIPEPTFIIDSGRGIYLVWKLRNEDKKALPRWTSVMNYLISVLEELGADHACADAARILRVPYTINTKSCSVVEIIEFNDLTYSLYEIIKEYDVEIQCKKSKNFSKKYPYNHATEKQRKYVADICNKLGLSSESFPDFSSFKETDTWIKLHKYVSVAHGEDKDNNTTYKNRKSLRTVLSSYCEEIRKLFSLRKGANCKRELGLFLYRYFHREMNYSKDDALEKTLNLNASLDCPFDEDYVITATASADRRIESGIPYRYKKSTIIKTLAITKEELKELPFLTADEESRKERRKMSNRINYIKRLVSSGKNIKKDEVLYRRAKIWSMCQNGISGKEIMNKLCISRATYYRDIAALTVKSILSAVKKIACGTVTPNTRNAFVMNIAAKLADYRKTIVSVCVSYLKAINGCVFVVSHFFSSLFIKKYTEGVPYSTVNINHVVVWLIKVCVMKDECEGARLAE